MGLSEDIIISLGLAKGDVQTNARASVAVEVEGPTLLALGCVHLPRSSLWFMDFLNGGLIT